ncbi:hypothetical protein NM208_g7220 [Fusarium decemcellulare]|uniref:Uncharacterized protein n=1 Tax=Fusarium decemcellulare TaxID=57161 RepID=A0ACC1SA90_9HYPO|nr:hypothetical protein NM208_g7220 [Fusarium decemcellulare]
MMEIDESPFVSQWEASLERCLSRLEPDDVDQIHAVTDAQQIRDFLLELTRTDASQPIKHSTSMILPCLDYLETFNDIFVKNCEARLETSESAKAGTQLAAEASSPGAVMKVAEMIKKLGQKIELFNECSRGGVRPAHLKETALDVKMELVTFFTDSIRFFRRDAPIVSDWGTGSEEGQLGRSRDQVWDRLMKSYNRAQASIDQSYQHIDQLAQLAKRNILSEDFHGQQMLLSLSGDSAPKVKPTCFMLPQTKDGRFYNRDSFTDRIEAFFQRPQTEAYPQFRSLVLYGIGGVGKTHVALKYANLQIRKKSLDVVLWFHSETDMSLSQSFTDAAIKLELSQAGKERSTENRILLLDWLQRAACEWLLVYDNAVEADILLPYWPQACKNGSVLVTSRNFNLKFGPADDGIEIPAFAGDSGSKFLLHLLRMDLLQDLSASEAGSALELAQQVDGHAQAISVMAGLIQTRLWSIQEFQTIYERNRGYLHGKGRHKSPNALTTIWKLSFDSLIQESATLLGILSYLSPDSVPQELFTSAKTSSLPICLQDCHQVPDFHDIAEPLMTQALVQRDKNTRAYSTHRLVQIQYRYYLAMDDRQKAFDEAVKLLCEGFGNADGQLYDRWAKCQMYIQQILSLKNNYKKDRSGNDRLNPTLEFCLLLANSSRYLVETADYTELEDFVTVALESFQSLPECEKARGHRVYSRILGTTGLLWGHRGFFSRAIPFVRECNKLESEREVKDWSRLSWTEVNLGNVLASASEYCEALEWELKALETRKKIADNESIKPNSVVQQNIGRCYTFLDRFDQAGARLQSAAKEFEDSQNWAMLAYTIFVQGTLERRQQKFKTSKEAYLRAQQVWVSGGKLKTHHFNGACMYKLGCVSGDLGEHEKAIEYLREALVVARLREDIMAGDYARVLHKLSNLLKRLPGNEVESAEMAAKASRIRRGLSPSQDDSTTWAEAELAAISGLSVDEMGSGLDDPDEERYDELVYILWR